MNEAQRKKRKLRASRRWKEFKQRCYERSNGRDEVTLKRLYKGWTLHHKNLREEDYDKIEDEGSFSTLNRRTHEMVHWGYNYWLEDEGFIERLVKLWEDMKRMSGYEDRKHG